MAKQEWNAQNEYIAGRAAITLGRVGGETCLAGPRGEIWEDGEQFKVWCTGLVAARLLGYQGVMAPGDEHMERITADRLGEALVAIGYSADSPSQARMANRRG